MPSGPVLKVLEALLVHMDTRVLKVWLAQLLVLVLKAQQVPKALRVQAHRVLRVLRDTQVLKEKLVLKVLKAMMVPRVLRAY